MPNSSNSPTFVVGIGASAGGLKPIEEFFDHMPAESGMAFVVVQHLSPDFKSLMDELLARHTRMAIHKVSNEMTIEKNSIYLIPPEKNMVMSKGKLLLTDKESERSLNMPIDIFFRSLAKEAGEKSVAIILSGTGSDGSRGIKDVRESGGLVLAQDVVTAAFDGMPRAAISTGVIDLICPPNEMPKQIIDYVNNGDREAVHQSEFPASQDAQDQSPLHQTYRLFRQKYNIDFSLYKPATITRRLERRVRMGGFSSIENYIEAVETDVEECDALFRDLLVEVTHFFRDPEAFKRLREDVIPGLIDQSDPLQEIRVWVCGCATGEEAYSMALLLAEGIEKSGRQQSFKVFATDVHRKSLEIASSGFYPTHSLENVPIEFHTKYFVKNNGICNLKREIRQSVIFAANDITRDPPFTRIDLISCRNVLIYLEPKIQKRVLSMFHFGLKTKGILFLGPSETVGELANEFEQLDRHWRIYRKRRDVRLADSSRIPLTPVLGSIVHERTSNFVGQSPPLSNQMWLSTAYEDLLAKHVPPSFLVNEYHELVHCFGKARKLLSPPEGKPTNDVLKMLEKDLSVAVSAAIHRATSEDIPVVYKGVRVQVGEEDERLYRITVEPYRKTDQSLFLIALEELQKVEPSEHIVEEFQSDNHSSERIGQLERELKYTRETLQATVEELESSNEELQATNEELIASNEELQSTNEELHSVNEELFTVNAEHKQKIEELTELTSDMDNLLRSTEIGTIFLDRNFNIRMFTPSISAGFNVLDQDVGRPIDHIAYKLDSPNLLNDAAAVLKTGNPRETEVRGRESKTFLQRIQPYRVEGAIQGIVLTLTDISAIKEAEKARATMLTLAEVSQELPDFAYAVSHDLQAPLRHISQYTEIMDSGLDSGLGSDNVENVRKANRIIKSSALKLRTMIDGLLAYSRINTLGKPFGVVKLISPLSESIDELQATIDADNAIITFDQELPSVEGDNDQLKLLFFHVLDNALKYKGDSDPVIKIETKLNKVDQVEVCISDNGAGIDERNIEDVFTIFRRHVNSEDTPGAGVGLAICRRIVLRHHGRIWINPEYKNGVQVCFTLRIPQDIDE